MKQKKILCLFDYGINCYTGFGTVSRNIKKEIKKAFGDAIQLDICAVNHFGDPYTEPDGTFVFSAQMSDVEHDDFGRFVFMKVLQENNYDGIFVMQDITVICPIIDHLEYIKRGKREKGNKVFKSIFYFPIDCPIIPKTTDGLEFFDCLVTYTEYGRTELFKARPDLKGKIKVVGHGTNFKEYYPLPPAEIQAFRREFFGTNADKFIISNINRNQARKDIPNTIFGFIEARKLWDDNNLPSKPFLYLHMHPTDPMGWDLRAIFLQLQDLNEYEDYYMLLPKEYETKMCPTSVVNQVYNASDVCLTTTTSEGWGLFFNEAASVKKPIIATYSTSFIEMSGYGKRGWMLECLYPHCNMTNIIREQTDVYEVGEKIIEVAKAHYGLTDRKEYEEKIAAAHQWATQLTWERVCKLWIQYFKETY